MRLVTASRFGCGARRSGRLRLAAAAGVTAGAVAVFMAGTTVSAATGPVSSTAASGTPHLYYSGTPVEENVRQLVQCGGKMYAVGKFTKIKRYSHVYTRNNVFSFSAAAPYAVTSWNPNVNGKVNSIAFNGSDCSVAYLGGNFSSVHGTAARYIVAVSTSTGAVVSSFRHSANGQVETVVSNRDHLLVGGYFTKINGTVRDYMASLNPSSGKDDGFVHLHISGHYQYCGTVSGKQRCAGNNRTRIYNQQLSHSGNLELVEGDFTSVGGKSRQQIFMLNLTGSTPVVTGWTSSEFNQHCWYSEPFYLRAASWSPDDSTVYTATTGYRLYNSTYGSYPLAGICDTAAAFPATQKSVSHKWINYTGCDSLYSTAADASTAYFGGHERWSQNSRGCDHAGSGAISAPGMEGLSSATGALTFNPTRSRGKGADDMLVTGAGLWIGSDNGFFSKSGKWYGSRKCDGKWGHAGICFFPYQ